MTRNADQAVIFQDIRFEALDALQRGMYTPNGNARPCVWQNYAPSRHVAPYCNVLSHVETLEDLLLSGSWCDDVVLEPTFDESEDTLRLFRWYGLAFLAFEECIADLRLVRRSATGGPKKVEADAEGYMGIINVVWKHRDRDHQGGAFHRVHHHGPYLFADRPGFRTALPADRCVPRSRPPNTEPRSSTGSPRSAQLGHRDEGARQSAHVHEQRSPRSRGEGASRERVRHGEVLSSTSTPRPTAPALTPD